MSENAMDDPESGEGTPGKGLPVDLRAMALGLWQWRWWFLGSLGVAMVVGLGAGKLFASRTFTAETLLLYQAPAPDTPEAATMPSLLTLLNMVKLPSQLDAVAERLKLGADTRTLGGATTVEIRPKTTLVSIRAKWDSPRTAADIANAVRDVFLESQTRLRRDEASSRVTDLEARHKSIAELLAKAEEALREFTKANRIIHLSEESRQLLEELATINLLYEQARIEQRSIQIQSQSSDRIIKELQAEMAKEQQAQAALSDALSETNIRIQRLREGIMDDKEKRYNDALLEAAKQKFARTQKLVELGVASQEDLDQATMELHSLEARAVDTPEIVAMREEIENLDKRVLPNSGGSGGVTGNLLKDVMFRSFEIRLQETTLAERVSSLHEAKSRVEERIERLPDLQRTFAQLSRDVGALEAEQSVVAARLGEARRLLEASALPFTLVSAAEPPPRSSTSNAKIIAGAVAMVIIAGCWSILLGAVLLDPRVRTGREMEIALGGSTPILGAIPCGNAAPILLVEEGQSDVIVEAFRETARQFRTCFPESGVRVLFSAPGHGEGVSAVVLNLAATLGRWGERVLIIDAHLDSVPVPPKQLSPVQRILSLAATMGVTRDAGPDESHLPEAIEAPVVEGLLEVLEAPERPLDQVIVGSRFRNVSILPRSVRRGSRDLLAGEVFRQRLAEASKLYTVILVDAPPILVSLDAENCALGVDHVVMVTRAMGPFRFAVSAAAERMGRVGRSPAAGVLAGVVPPYGPSAAKPSEP